MKKSIVRCYTYIVLFAFSSTLFSSHLTPEHFEQLENSKLKNTDPVLYAKLLGSAQHANASNSKAVTRSIAANCLVSSISKKRLRASSSVSIGTDFQTLTHFDYPPVAGSDTAIDASGAVSPYQVVTATNVGVRSFTLDRKKEQAKADNILNCTLSQFVGFPNELTGDPDIVYDPDTKRWFLLCIDSGDLQVAAPDRPPRSLGFDNRFYIVVSDGKNDGRSFARSS